jgi:uncharacterized Zn finger protein (UPF0148 family)
MNTNGDSTNPDNDWRPPTEAEKKVLMAKRERSDKISKRMAEYLLKGYKMLATTCRICDTIELQDKQDKIFCIACTEIDCHENLKDNPALSSSAANRTLAESSERRTNASTSFPEGRPMLPVEGESQRVPAELMQRLPSLSTSNNTARGDSSAVNNVSTSSPTGPFEVAVHDSMDVIIQKLRRATQALAVTENVELSRNYVVLIKECADAIIALRRAET